jgi:membrane fusion protein (multidrug efflux system)
MSSKIKIALAVIVVVLGVGGFWFWQSSQGKETTDDAQVDGHVYSVSSRVTGTIIELNVVNNQVVKVGDILAKLDPRDYEIEVMRAKADVAEAEARAHSGRSEVALTQTNTRGQISHADASISEAEAQIGASGTQLASAEARRKAAQARIAEARANLDRTNKDLERWRTLVAKDEVSRQQFDAAEASARAMQAQLDAAIASEQEAANAVKVIEAQLQKDRAALGKVQADRITASGGPEEISTAQARANSAVASVAQARARLADAELKLAYTVIRAPVSGVASKRNLETGQTVQAGQSLLAIVPLDDIWVTANFKETQLRDMREGQPARFSVDAYGGREFTGKVESIAAATGARFSLLPPENASGNFVKVVQRIPVKIALDKSADPSHPLRPGMSVEATVFTDPSKARE